LEINQDRRMLCFVDIPTARRSGFQGLRKIRNT